MAAGAVTGMPVNPWVAFPAAIADVAITIRIWIQHDELECIEDAVIVCIAIMDIEKWGKRDRINRCLRILAMYGGAARPVLPQLRELEAEDLAKAFEPFRQA